MSSDSGQQQSQIKTGPPDYLKPDIQYGTQQARSLYDQGGPQVYPGSTVANRSPETQQGWAATSARALAGSPVVGAAQNWATGILNGSSPTYGQLGDSVWSQLRPNTDAMFSSGGRYGPNAAYGNAISTGFTNAIAPTFANLQATAASQAPTLANQDYTDLAALQGVGTARDTYGQNVLSDTVNRFDANQNRPYNNLSNYMSLLYGNPSKTQTTTQPSQGFNWGGLLGGALGAVL